jgi:hypothetical protein
MTEEAATTEEAAIADVMAIAMMATITNTMKTFRGPRDDRGLRWLRLCSQIGAARFISRVCFH